LISGPADRPVVIPDGRCAADRESSAPALLGIAWIPGQTCGPPGMMMGEARSTGFCMRPT
jgi:hypothetical protein